MAAPPLSLSGSSPLLMLLLLVFRVGVALPSSPSSPSDCGGACALCVYRQLERPATFPPALACSLECPGGLDGALDGGLRSCGDFRLREEPNPLDSEPHPPQEPESGESSESQRRLVKKYGGFMKRYGGFMSRRSSSMPEGALPDPQAPDEEEAIRVDILRLLNAATEPEARVGAGAKRYGGFMRRDEDAELLEAVLGRGLKKRYGGFMRRVGRPEWLLDTSSKGGAGSLKRAEPLKRYGGFMD